MTREKYYREALIKVLDLLCKSSTCPMFINDMDIICKAMFYTDPDDGCKACIAEYFNIKLNSELEVM